MTKETFTTKSYLFKVFSALFALTSVFFLLFRTHIGWPAYFLALLGIGVAYVFLKIPLPKIEVDDSGIKEIHRDSTDTGLIARIVQPDAECEWNWIQTVSTTRFNSGSFLTTLYLFEEIPNKPKLRVQIASALYKDYVSILKIIKARASRANFDETTESILNGQTDIRSVKPLYWGLFAFIVVSAFLYILITSKG
jgi:hypothetical protein